MIGFSPATIAFRTVEAWIADRLIAVRDDEISWICADRLPRHSVQNRESKEALPLQR
jgi:hypothetical protein